MELKKNTQLKRNITFQTSIFRFHSWFWGMYRYIKPCQYGFPDNVPMYFFWLLINKTLRHLAAFSNDPYISRVIQPHLPNLPSLKLAWKFMVGRQFSLWETLFSGAILVVWTVFSAIYSSSLLVMVEIDFLVAGLQHSSDPLPPKIRSSHSPKRHVEAPKPKSFIFTRYSGSKFIPPPKKAQVFGRRKKSRRKHPTNPTSNKNLYVWMLLLA